MTMDGTAKKSLINSPFPLIILENNGNILWRSSKFAYEFMDNDPNIFLDTLLKSINEEILKKKADNEKSKTLINKIKIGNKTYKVLGEYIKSESDKINISKNMSKNIGKNVGKSIGKNASKNISRNLAKTISKSDKYLIVLYFIDITDYEKDKKLFEDSKMCVGLLMIDNYEDIMQQIKIEERPQIIAKIEREIYDWVNPTNGIIIKNDRNTYTYILEKKYLNMLKENKFEILDKIKEIPVNLNVQITLSIAISIDGSNDYEKYKSALETMDIVLGRGGDQVAIKEKGNYIFFGGRTQEPERRTKVKVRVMAHALENLIKNAENVLIMGHTNGDIDSLGSGLGIYRLSKSLGKEAYIVNNTNGMTLSNFIDELKKDEEYKNSIIPGSKAETKITKNTLLVITDTSKKGYVDEPKLVEKASKIAVIDHHIRSTDYIENATLILQEVYASSASELVTEILQYTEMKVKLKPIEVEALYGGIMVDTKNFTFKTGVRTFEAAAYLRKLGVDIIKVKKWFQADLRSYNEISDIVKSAEIIDKSIAVAIYSKEDKDANLICAKAADELLTISDITTSFVIGSTGEKCFISGRSIGDINVQLILEKLGGGGHLTFAGAQIEGNNIEEAKQKLISKINEYLEEVGTMNK